MIETIKNHIAGIISSLDVAKEKILFLVTPDKAAPATEAFDAISNEITRLQNCLQDASIPVRLQELDKKIDRWSEMNIDQLSFFNNILVILGTGFLGFAFKDTFMSGYRFALGKGLEIVPTASFLSFLFMAISILSGLLCGFNRMLVFNHSLHLMRVRKNFVQRRIDLPEHHRVNVRFPIRFWLRKPGFYSIFESDYASNATSAKKKIGQLACIVQKLRSYTTLLLQSSIFFFICAIICYVIWVVEK